MDMSLDTIKKLAEELGNEQLQTAVAGLESSTNDNIGRINSLEKDLQKSIDKRDRQAQLVKSTFGVDEITEDSLMSVLSSKGNPDDALRAENDKLVSLVESLKAEKDTLSNEYTATQNKYKIEKSLIDLGAVNDTASKKAYGILLDEVSKGFVVDDSGDMVLKANDGTTVRNNDGSPMSLGDRYNMIKDSDEFSFLFNQKKPKSGSGATGGSKGGSKNVATGNVVGTKEEQLAYIKQKFNIG